MKENYVPETATLQDCLDLNDMGVKAVLSNGYVSAWVAEKGNEEFVIPIDKRPRKVEECYKMGIMQEGKIYPNCYVSELKEFTESQKAELLAGEMVRVQESPERWIYICSKEM